VTEIIINTHKPCKVRHAGLFTSSYHVPFAQVVWRDWPGML